MIAPSRRTRLLPLIALLAASALALAFGASPAQAAAYRSCSLTQKEQQPGGTVPKPTYNFTLKRKGTGCTTAKRVMKAFHSCRALTSTRCTKKVRTHWTCTGAKDSSTAGIFYAHFTCKWGTRRVRGTYQQSIPGA